MTEPLLIQRQRTILRDLIQLVADRVRAETAAESGFTSSQCTAEQEFEQTRGCITGRFESDLQAVEREYRDTHELVTARFESEYNAAQRESGCVLLCCLFMAQL